MHLALLLAFISFVGWGTGDLFTIFVVRKIGANLTAFWILAFGFFLSLLSLPFVPHNFGAVTLPLLLINILLGVCYIVGQILVSEAFRISSAPVVGVIVPSVPAVVLVLSIIFFHDKVTLLQIISILIVLLGISLCSVDLKELKKAKTIFDKGAMLALIAIFLFAIFFTFSRILIAAYGWFLPTFIAVACFPLILLFAKKQKEKFIVPKQLNVLFACLMVGLLIRAGDYAFNYGISIPNASGLIAPIANAAPILFVISSYLIFKDKLTRQQILGIIITLIGIILLTTLG
jgi:uncharacterized membrane protein